MGTKVKRFERIVSFILAVVMLFGLLASNDIGALVNAFESDDAAVSKPSQEEFYSDSDADSAAPGDTDESAEVAGPPKPDNIEADAPAEEDKLPNEYLYMEGDMVVHAFVQPWSEIPENAELKGKMLLADSDEYVRAYKAALEQIDVAKGEELIFTSYELYFEIDGKRIELEPGEVFAYVEMQGKSSEGLSVVHITSEGSAEILKTTQDALFDISLSGIMGIARTVTVQQKTSVISAANGSRPARVISHTKNINENGVQIGDYAEYQSLNHVITIEGAAYLFVTIEYGGDENDWACMWQGSHPDYTASADYDTSYTGRLGGAHSIKTYVIDGDTVTLAFYSDGAICGDSFGYYAAVEAVFDDASVPAWELQANEDGTYTLIFTEGGEIRSFINNGDVLAKLGDKKDLVTEIRLNAGTTGIWNGAFADWTSIEKVTAPENANLSYISLYAFCGCTGLETVDLSGDGLEIEANAFYGCASLESIKISGDGIHIGSGAFQNLTTLASVSIDGSGAELESYAFYNCSSLTDLNVSGAVLSSDVSYAFYGCTNLTLDMRDWDTSAVTNMDHAFYIGPKTITFGENFSFIGENAIDHSYWVDEKGEKLLSTELYALADAEGSYTADETAPGGTYYAYLYENGELVFRSSKLEDSDPSYTEYIVDSSVAYDYSKVPWYSDRTKVTKVIFADKIIPVYMNYWFRAMTALESIEGIENLDMSSLIGMEGIFSYSFAKTDIDLSGWDLPSLTNMEKIFQWSKLVSIDLSGWNVTSLVDMTEAFANCTSLTSLNLSGWYAPVLTTLESAFSGCEKLQTLDMNDWNVPALTSLSGIFTGYTALTTLNMNGWKADSLTSLGSVFRTPTALKTLNMSDWDVPSLTSMSSAFSGHSGLTTVNMSNWNAPSLTTMYYTFNSCKALTSVDLSGWGDMPALTSMERTFMSSSKLQTLDFSGWGNMPKLTTLYQTFYSCQELRKLDLSGWGDMPALTTMYEIFFDCRKIAAIDMSSWGNMPELTNLHNAFYRCYLLESLDLFGWNVPKLTDISGLFNGCSVLETIDMSNWKADSLTALEGLFSNHTMLKEINMSNFNAPNLTNISRIFNGCTALTTIKIDGWNTKNFTDISSAFKNCIALETLAILDWDTSGIENMAEVFYGCGYTALDISSWDTSNVTNMTNMFAVGPYEITLGENFVFCGTDAFEPSYWKKKDTNTVYVGTELCAVYNSAMAGTYVFDDTDNGGRCYVFLYENKELVFQGGSLEPDETKGALKQKYIICLSTAYSNSTGYNYSTIQIPWYDNNTLVNTVVYANEISPVRMDYWFYGMSNLTAFEGMDKLDMSGVISLASTFQNCSKLETLDLSSWGEMPMLVSMKSTFNGCSKLESIDFSGWGKMSDLADMTSAFYYCRSLKTLDLSSWGEIPSLADMTSTFWYCTALEMISMDNWKVDSLASLDSTTFKNCTVLETINISNWNAPLLTSLEGVFDSLTMLTTVNINGWIVPSLTSIDHLFYECSALTTLNMNRWDAPNLMSMSYVVQTCQGNVQRTVNISGWKVEKLTSLNDIFNNSHITTVNMNGWYAPAMTKIGSTYSTAGGSSLETVYMRNWDAPNLTDLSGLFSNKSALTTVDMSGWTPFRATDISSVFYGCSSLTTVLGLEEWDTSALKNMSKAFYNCYFLELDLSSWNTSGVTDMTNTFAYGPYKITFGENFRFAGTNAFEPSYWRRIEPADETVYHCEDLCIAYNNDTVAMAGTYIFDQMDVGGRCYALLYNNDGNYELVFQMTPEPEAGRGELIEAFFVNTSTAYGSVANSGALRISTPWTNYRSSVKKVVFRDEIIPRDISFWFTSMTSLLKVEYPENLNTSNIKNMRYAFYRLSSLTELDTSTWDMSSLENMDYAFESSKLTIIDTSGWNLSNLTSMKYTFGQCQALTSLDTSNWGDMSKVKDMSYAFYFCSNLTWIDTGSWTLESLTTLDATFCNCYALVSLDTRNWNLSKVTTFKNAFNSCSSLSILDTSGWSLPNVSSMEYAFSNCGLLTNIDTSGWNLSTKLTNLSGTFNGCSSLTSLDLSAWDVSKVTALTYTFNGCSALTTIAFPASPEKVFGTALTNMSHTFSGCSVLPAIDLSIWDVSKVMTLTYTFSDCEKLTNIVLPSSPEKMFSTALTDMSYIFNGCTAFDEIDISAWDLSHVTTMSNAFNGCEKLMNIVFPTDEDRIFSTSLTNLEGTFNGCKSLTALDCNAWNVSKVTSMNSIFMNCSSLSDLKVSEWDTPALKNIGNMFSGCTSLKVLDVTNWDLTALNSGNSYRLVDDADNLTEITLGPKSLISATVYIFDLGGSGADWYEKGTENRYTRNELYTYHFNKSKDEAFTQTYYKVRKITFDANGGVAQPNSYGEWWPGHQMTEIPTATRRGADFDGWWSELVGGEQLLPAEDDCYYPEYNTYYAHWKEHKYTLILVANDGSNEQIAVTLEFNEIYQLSENLFTRDNYLITGWNKAADGSGTGFRANEEILQMSEYDGDSVYLFAQWTRIEDIVTVTFDSDGGTLLPSWKMTRGDAVGPLPAPVKDGFSFGGWKIKESADSRNAVNSTVISSTRIWGDITLIAVWEKDPVVTFNYNIGAYPYTETRTVLYGHAIGNLPEDIFGGRYGVLIGWFKEDGTKVTRNTTVTEDITLYAHWGWRPKFNANGGKITSSLDDFPYQEGSDDEKPWMYKIEKFPDVEYDGYELIGWYLSDGVTPVKAGDTVDLSEGIEIVAHWKRNNTVIITLSPNGGTMKNTLGKDTTQTINYEVYAGRPVTELPIPIRNGYEFIGWLDAFGGLGYVDEDTCFDTNTFLIAQWKEKDCTVTFHANDEDGDSEHTASFYNNTAKTKTETVANGDTLNTLPGCNRATYTLEGWYPYEDGTYDPADRLTADTVITENADYYAHWVKFLTTVSENKEDGEDGDENSGLHHYTYGVEWANASNSNVDNVGYNLEFHPTNNAKQTAQLHIYFELNDALGREEPMEPGTVYFKIPKSVFYDANKNPVDTNNIKTWLTEYPTIGNQLFSYIEMDDCYYLVNTKAIDTTGFSMTIEYTVSPNAVEGGAFDADGVKNGVTTGDGHYVYGEDTDGDGEFDVFYNYYKNNFEIEFGIDEEHPADFENDSYPWDAPQSKQTRDMSIEMHTRVETTASKTTTDNPFVYTWSTAWGAKPEDADEYFYIVWTLRETYSATTNQKSTFVWDEDITVHDGTVVYMNPSRGTHNGDGSSGSNNIFTCTVVTKHPISLLSDIPTTGRVFYNEAIVTETWGSGYETKHRVSAEVTLYSDEYSRGEFDKDRYNNSRYIDGGQEDILDDGNEISMPWKLVYDGGSNERPTWDEVTGTYTARNRTIRMLDGVHWNDQDEDRYDLMISSGSGSGTAPYIWEPVQGNTALNDDDYHFTKLTFTLTEYDAICSIGTDENGNRTETWSKPVASGDLDKYESIDVYIRHRYSETFEFYASINYSETKSIDLPDDTVGFEIRHCSEFYWTYLYVRADMKLIPTQKIKAMVQNDVDANVTTIIKNRATCDIWFTDEGEESRFFHADSKEAPNNSALSDLYELNISKTYQYTTKFGSDGGDDYVTVDAVSGMQYAAAAICGYNENNSGRTKRLRTGVFYDLLPEGTYVDPISVLCLTGVKATNSNSVGKSLANAYAAAFKAAFEEDSSDPYTALKSTSFYSSYKSRMLDAAYYDIRFTENWEDSGRTMMILSVAIPENVSSTSITAVYILRNPNDNIKASGTTPDNDVAFANTSSGRVWPDQLYGDITDLKEGDQALYQELQKNNDGFISYAQASTTFQSPAAYSWGFEKLVNTGSGYRVSETTLPDRIYTYRLSYTQSDNASTKNVVLYDIIENAARRRNADGSVTDYLDSEWHGTFVSVNIECIFTDETKGTNFAYTIYYSTKEDLRSKDLEDIKNPAKGSATYNEMYDLTNTAYWTKYDPDDETLDPGSITAIAVDFSKGADNKEFTFNGEVILNVYITMEAPDSDYVLDNKLKDKTAYNEGVIYALQTSGSGSTSNEVTPLYSDAQVTLRDVDLDLDKDSNLGKGKEDEPIIVEVNQQVTYELRVTNKDADLTAYDIVVEDTVPDGLSIMYGDIMVHFGDPEKAIPIGTSPRVSLEIGTRTVVDENGNETQELTQKLTFRISSLLPGETIYLQIPVIVTVTNKIFKNDSKITEAEGMTKDIPSKPTWHEVIPKMETKLELTKKVEGRHAPTAADEFKFRAALIMKNGEIVTDGTIYTGATINTSGLAEIGPIKYSKKDVGSTFLYKITEIEGDDKYIEYSNEVYYAKVTVSAYYYGENGEKIYITLDEANESSVKAWKEQEFVYLESETTYYSDAACTEQLTDIPTITNTYIVHGEAVLEITKIVKEMDDVVYVIGEGDFIFTAVEVDGDTLEPVGGDDAPKYKGVTISSDGKVIFETIKYDKVTGGSTFIYRITEDKGSIPGIKYSGEKIYAEVQVTDKIVDPDNDDTFEVRITYYSVPEGGTWENRQLLTAPTVTNEYYRLIDIPGFGSIGISLFRMMGVTLILLAAGLMAGAYLRDRKRYLAS